MQHRSLTPIVVGSLISAALSSACSPAVDPAEPTQPDEPEAVLMASIERSRTVSASIDFSATVVIDGATASEFSAVGVVDGQRGDFEFEIAARPGAGITGGLDQPVTVRRVGARMFQRGPVLSQVVPEIGDRWLEVVVADRDGVPLAPGLIGTSGFAALDLLADIESVTSPEPGRFVGSLGVVRIDGRRIAQSDETTFEVWLTDGDVTLTEGRVESLAVMLKSGTGVELRFDATWAPPPGEPNIVTPDGSEIYTP